MSTTRWRCRKGKGIAKAMNICQSTAIHQKAVEIFQSGQKWRTDFAIWRLVMTRDSDDLSDPASDVSHSRWLNTGSYSTPLSKTNWASWKTQCPQVYRKSCCLWLTCTIPRASDEGEPSGMLPCPNSDLEGHPVLFCTGRTSSLCQHNFLSLHISEKASSEFIQTQKSLTSNTRGAQKDIIIPHIQRLLSELQDFIFKTAFPVF